MLIVARKSLTTTVQLTSCRAFVPALRRLSTPATSENQHSFIALREPRKQRGSCQRSHRTHLGCCYSSGSTARESGSAVAHFGAQSFRVERLSTSAVKGNGSRAGVLKLILYSKPDCHLCHGLKEKIELALNKAQFMPSELSDAEIEVRDITTNPRWEKLYGMVIPVLTVVAPGSDDEVKVRRVPPRSNSDKVAKHILAAVSGDEDILE